MAQVNKIDSNATGLRIAEESSLKVLPGTPDWEPFEPNSYADFGGEVTTVARNPINASRQRKKGVLTDLDASGGFNTDLTQDNLQTILQGYFFADLRRKGEETPTNVDGTAEEYDMADTTGFLVGSLVLGKNFTNAENNGLKRVVTVNASTSIEVAEDIVDEGSPPSTAEVVVVGHQGAAGDIDVDASGSLPAITSTALDFTTLGLIVGEWIFIGGDSATLKFSNSENNGFKRIRSIAANRIEFDKSFTDMVTESSTTETVQLFFGRVLKNESDTSLIKRRSWQLERTLGAPDDSSPGDVQAEYLPGGIANEFSLNVPTADKVTADLSFIALDNETIDGPTSLKSGNRPTLQDADAFNTSSDISHIRMSVITAGDENPTALFAFAQELTLTINNNASPNKALGTLGAFEVTAGTFEVGGSITAYFSNVSAVDAVRSNSDVTLDLHFVKANAGITIDVPLIALGDGRLNVEQDEAITLPLDMPAATAAKIDTNLDHTLLMVFWDYLPDLADV